MIGLFLAIQITCVPYLHGAFLCRFGGDGGPFWLIAPERPIKVLYASLERARKED